MATASKGQRLSSKGMAIKRQQQRAAAGRCQLDIEIPVHGDKCELSRETHLRRGGAKRAIKVRETAKQRKERKDRERLAMARHEHEHGDRNNTVLVMASDMEEAIERALETATAGDWRLRARVPKREGAPMVEQRDGNYWLVTVVTKLPAKPVDWEWH